MIVTKQELPDDPTPSEAPPSYESVGAPRFTLDIRTTKSSGSPRTTVALPAGINAPGPSSSSPAVARSTSESYAKGKAKASSWFNFGSSRTTRDVHNTVLGLIRDLVREQEVNAPAAHGILESCAEACSGRDLSLSTILQEKSIENHTPLYWAIVKRGPDGHNVETALPDLLTALFSYASPLTLPTIADIRHACLVTSDQRLFQRLRMSPEFAPLSGTDEMLLGGTISPDEIAVEDVPGDEGAFIVHFCVPQFQKRMQVSQLIELEFIARARMWKLEFFVSQQIEFSRPRKGSWCICLSLLENSPPTWLDSRLIISEPTATPSTPPSTLSPSSSLLDRVTGSIKTPKPPITIRIRSSQQLPASPGSSKRTSRMTPGIVVALEDDPVASSLQYAGTSYISADEILRARLEARLGRSEMGPDCVIC